MAADKTARRLLLFLTVAVFLLPSCGRGGDPEALPPPVTVTATVTPEVPPTRPEAEGESTAQATSSATPLDSEDNTGPTATPSSTSTGGGLVDAGAQGRELTLADFFNPEETWDEDRYDVADRVDVPGIATTVDGCGLDGYSARELELRLANNFDTLAFEVGQGNLSENSDQNISVEVVANGKQVEIQSVAFNEIRAISVPVVDVNALKIRLALDDKVEDCGGYVTAVLSGLTLS